MLSSFGTIFAWLQKGFFDNIRVMMDIHRVLSIIVEWEELMLCIVFLLSRCLQSSPLHYCRDIAASTYLVKKTPRFALRPKNIWTRVFGRMSMLKKASLVVRSWQWQCPCWPRQCPACRSRDTCVWCDCRKTPPSTELTLLVSTVNVAKTRLNCHGRSRSAV